MRRGRRGGQERSDGRVRIARIRTKHIHGRQRTGGTLERARHLRAIDDEQARLGVGDAPRDVVGIVVDVERNDDQPESKRGEIECDPVDAVFQANRNAISRDQAQHSESCLPASGLRRDLADRNVAPFSAVEMAVEHLVGCRNVLPEILADIGHAAFFGTP